jgi:tetratricopeptide (TPR) repeat protein
MMKRLLLIPFLLISLLIRAQDMDQSLAVQFYQNQEYTKAAELFSKLYDKNPNEVNYRYLYNTYIQLKEYDKLDKIVKKNIKKYPAQLGFIVDLGNLYKEKGDLSGAEDQFDKAIKALIIDDAQITGLANTFVQYNQLDYAAKTYERARTLFRNDLLYTFQLADLYGRMGKKKEAVSSYLSYLEGNPGDEQTVKNRLQDAIQDEAYYTEIQQQLLGKVQKNAENDTYPELLIWMYLQRSDYRSAFIQVKALDRRRKENGLRVIGLARNAMEDKAYDAAIEMYQYILDKGKMNSLYQPAMQELLNARKERLSHSFAWTKGEVDTLLQQYDVFLSEYGLNRATMNTVLEKAQLQALYLNNFDTAIVIIENLLKVPQLERTFKSQAKIALGDFYLLKGEDWEASLLYSQVDKDMKDEPLGEMARFKNAKLSYYQGEFEWSQAQLNILKASTSELIANDALDLSVFILDNLGLDTTLYPMQMFAKADLLVYQNQLDRALLTLDTVTNIFPTHALMDDILFAKANIYLKKQNFTEAEKYLLQVLARDSSDILADNATFTLAGLYETQLKNKDKAMEMYQNIILNYKDSIFVIEARKRYRQLRGDAVQ